MDKIWYIIINGDEGGPYSLRELAEDSRLTQDTLVWKEGFESWVPIHDVPELNELFKEEIPMEEEDEEKGRGSHGVGPPDKELVIDFQKEPSYLYFWLVIAAIVITYVLYELYWWK
ncbi:MAG: hypothetical protein K940chlam7_00318 [Chlamydiae bacterium]|nr:hypothetical protein [Chlamydiota bacterium]